MIKQNIMIVLTLAGTLIFAHHMHASPEISQNKTDAAPLSQLLAKEVIKLKLSQPATENEAPKSGIFLTNEAQFELVNQKDGSVCIISNFYINADLAIDALKIQNLKRNPAINPYGRFSIVAQLRVALFEMTEENNPKLEPKEIDAQTISRYLINADQEQLLHCITCITSEQYEQWTKEAQKELKLEQERTRQIAQTAFVKIRAADHEMIKKLMAKITT